MLSDLLRSALHHRGTYPAPGSGWATLLTLGF